MRRREVMALAGLGMSTLAGFRPAQAVTRTLRMGYQKYGTLVLLKERGTLEKRLAPSWLRGDLDRVPGRPSAPGGAQCRCHRFRHHGRGAPDLCAGRRRPSGLCRLRAAGADGRGHPGARQFTIKTVAELKGAQGSAEQGLQRPLPAELKALEASSLTLADIQPAYMPPADARAAFERGAVDAWVIWDPFLAAAQAATGARMLADGTGLVDNHQFFLASQDLVAERFALGPLPSSRSLMRPTAGRRATRPRWRG